MNVAVILAGGSGRRTEQDIPKQFMNVNEKPILVYTLEVFQKHPEVDAILAVCIDGWHDILWAYAKKYGITKLKWIISGGHNGHESTKKGIYALTEICSEDDIVIIHDAIRPSITLDIISDCIETCRLYGSGLSAIRCQETIVRTKDGIKGDTGIERQEIMRVQTPQAYRYDKAKWAYEEAELLNITDTVYINMLMLKLKEEVYFSKGSAKNIKITTMEDIELFKSLITMVKEDWVK